MKRILVFITMALLYCSLYAQNMTDISLRWKGSNVQEYEISSGSGNLYQELAHHGPAVENEWIGLRFYFDHKVAIDVYNKTRARLELTEAQWYPTVEKQNEGWGADQYKVGSTVGLGGVRLWDPEKKESVFLNPVTQRTARVVKEANISYMEMLSEDVPYRGDSVDILVRVTVFSGFREAKVEAFAFSDKPVYFLTGINYHEKTQSKQGDNFICTWGIHPEDVAAFQLKIGAAIIFHPDNFVSISQRDNQYELVSKPCKYMSVWITSACEKEKELNTYERFVEYVSHLEL